MVLTQARFTAYLTLQEFSTVGLDNPRQFRGSLTYLQVQCFLGLLCSERMSWNFSEAASSLSSELLLGCLGPQDRKWRLWGILKWKAFKLVISFNHFTSACSNQKKIQKVNSWLPRLRMCPRTPFVKWGWAECHIAELSGKGRVTQTASSSPSCSSQDKCLWFSLSCKEGLLS